MKILLVYPEYPDTFWSFSYALPFISKKAAFPPLGLLTVASMLPEDWKLKLVDMNVEELTESDIWWADMVFINAMLVQGNSAKEVISMCNDIGTPVVVGGPAFTSEYEKFEGVDHFILGEAEITLGPFLADLQAGTAKKIYVSDEKPDMKTTPIPKWSLVNFSDYASVAIQFSRGCPFNCNFCDITKMYGRLSRTKLPRQIIEEMQSLYDAGWKGSVFFVDDNFIGNRKNVRELLRWLIDWQEKHRYPFLLFTEASIDLAKDEELMNLMSAANFARVFIGIESSNEESLKESGKIQNIGIDLEEAIGIIHQHGMQVMGGFVIGFDKDDESIFSALAELIKNTGIVTAMVGTLTALPQTQLWQRLQDEGRLLGDTTGENTDSDLNFVPKMDKDVLVNGYKDLVVELYSPKVYYKRIDTLFKNYNSKSKSRLSLADIMAFFKSLYVIGFSRSGFYFWKILLKTALIRPNLFHTAIELAIFGWHFRIIAEKMLKSK
ncbi:B12-binding domain-containing radical SAM protein [Patescibacteria group bacterium]